MAKHAASVLAVLALCAAVATASFYYDVKTYDKDFLLKQKKIYNLVYHVSQPDIVNPELYKLGKTWNFDEKIDFYTDKDAVREFEKLYKSGTILPRGEMFSVYYPKLMKESLALFRVFYYAKDFDTFFSTALWARIYMNEGSYLCALYQAVIRRPDTKYLQLPPPYEFYPYAFFNAEVLEKAKNAHLYREIMSTPSGEGHNSVIINANYSGWYMNRDYDMETKINYFTEDIGLNSFYFYFRQNSPFWLESEKYGLEKSYRGESYLYGHQQLMARYYLERIANGLGRIEDFDWHGEFYPGYYPTMTYHNGLPFPQRPQWSKIPHYKYKYMLVANEDSFMRKPKQKCFLIAPSIILPHKGIFVHYLQFRGSKLQAIEDMESRLANAIDLGYVIDADGKHVKIYTPEGLNILGNMIEGNEDSCNKNYYGSIDAFSRKILGFNLEPKSEYQIIPSALESFASSLRDPAFYRIYQRIYFFYLKYKSHMKPYTKDELVYPGVKIESVAVDKLLTYFDDFDATISNGLLVSNQKEADSFLVKVRQQRLNHKPFTVHLGLNSDKATKVAVQIFLGPKYNSQHEPIDFATSYKLFYELDYWIADLTPGANKIERSSNDFFFTSPDQMPSELFYKSIESALADGGNVEYQQRIYGFPQRLILPKGRRGGSSFQLLVYVSPIVEDPLPYESRVFGNYLFNRKPIGFPLDKPVEPLNFSGPNIYFKDIVIYHKYDVDINATV